MGEKKLPTVTEAEADNDTSKIYQDIKTTMGVALVNLVWRHLAVSPRVLQWSWQALKPHYARGTVPSAAWLLREALEIPDLGAITACEWTQLGTEGKQVSELDAVLQTYERGNAQNLVAMCYLQAGLANAIGNSNLPTLNAHQQAAERADRVTTRIPPLPDLESLDSETIRIIHSMTTAWVPDQYRGITPSVFRHISHWPGFLRLYHKRLQTLKMTSSAALDLMGLQTIADARNLAIQMGPVSSGMPVLSDYEQRWLHSALTLFIEGMISRGVVIVPAMRATYPAI